jgi:hypothetical protein
LHTKNAPGAVNFREHNLETQRRRKTKMRSRIEQA